MLTQKILKVRDQKIKFLSILLISLFAITDTRADTLDIINSFDKSHSEEFGNLLVQDTGGRIKPIDTLAREILNKVYKAENFYGLTATQVFLGMTIKPQEWQSIKFIKVKSKAINEVLDLNVDDKYLAFVDFFTPAGEYKLSKYLEEANQKRASYRTQFEKDIIKIDERINICYMVYVGSFLRIYPKPNDSSNRWYSPIEAMESFEASDSEIIKDLTYNYFNEIDVAIESNNWDKADDKLLEIKKYQEFYGKELFPSSSKIYAELLYNKLNLFVYLSYLYLIVGVLLLVVSFSKIIKPKIEFYTIVRYSRFTIYLGFAVHTFALLLRWYISGHAPWSNGFESMIYIAWSMIVAGLILSKRDSMTLSATTILSALTLFVAHLSWMDPEISNLVPVLKSYWLTIHVSMISGSYGFLALGAILGFINLILFIFRRPSNNSLDLSIKELSYIAEKSLIIGLVFLTIGNFLGGVWANESWGRYWGWDPKETWTLVTMLLYAFVLHMRFIPQINSIYAFNLASLLAFSSVLMTYFGVNFYLSGLHSYAKGDPVPIPDFVYYSIFTIALVGTLAYKKRNLSA
jgi:cytochrome c-type biogenesis protein CcsB